MFNPHQIKGEVIFTFKNMFSCLWLGQHSVIAIPQLSPVNFSPSPAGWAGLLMLKWSSFPLSFARHSTANIMAMSQMGFCFLPLQDHIRCCTEMPLSGNVLPWMLSETVVLFIHFSSQIWLEDGKLGFSVEKT